MLYTTCHPYSEVGSGLAAVWGSQNNRVCLSPCLPVLSVRVDMERGWLLQLGESLRWVNFSLEIHFIHGDVPSETSHYRREGAWP